MTDTKTEPAVLPAAASLSGKENAYILHCTTVGQSMLYCSCLARLGAIDSPGVRVPADWGACKTARDHNQCPAADMCKQELLQDKAIYFQPRGVIAIAPDPTRKWVLEPSAPKKPAEPAPAKKAVKGPMLGGLDAAAKTSYADVIKVTKPTAAPSRMLTDQTDGLHPTEAPKMLLKMLPGETPIQAARRRLAEIRAARTNQENP